MIEVITAFLLVLSMSVFVAHACEAYRTLRLKILALRLTARPRLSSVTALQPQGAVAHGAPP